MADSPGSPLSSHASSEFTDDVRVEDIDAGLDYEDDISMPPAKKQKLSRNSYRSTPQMPMVEEYDTDISEDTDTSAPASPTTGPTISDEPEAEQVTVCRWTGCDAGDLGDMDRLVTHIHDAHIGARQKKYSCEWEGCPRIGHTHASGYALRAHMRSHTREKPFYCALPGELYLGCVELLLIL